MFIQSQNVSGLQSCIAFIIDGGGSVPTTGIRGFLYVPYACTITAAVLLADQLGSAVVDIWKTPLGSFPATDANSIVASAPPTLASLQSSLNFTLVGWTTSISPGDTLTYNLDSVATLTKLTVALAVTKT